jgi:DNA-directed RNA polymerase specialized sigma subunit
MEGIHAFLNQTRGEQKQRARQKQKYIEKIFDLRLSLLPNGISYDRDKILTSPEDKLLKTFVKIEETEEKLRELVMEQQKAKCEIIKRVRKLDNQEREIIVRYYGSAEDIRQIAFRMKLSTRHTFRLKEKAIKDLKEAE